jgi:Fe-Mn family superoxide dismutase
MSYIVQESLKPTGLKGISDEQIEQHWELYKGYVTNVNGLLEDLAKAEIGSRAWSELKRRAGFEFNGMVLHEFYFGNLVAGAQLRPRSPLGGALGRVWGSLEAWKEDFAATGEMRGIGWAILYHDIATDHLFNWWVTGHEMNHPAGLNPILVLDVFEHAYMVDYGAGGRTQYVEAFLENVNWDVVEQRSRDSKAGRVVARF